jgi:hypothetical protein
MGLLTEQDLRFESLAAGMVLGEAEFACESSVVERWWSVYAELPRPIHDDLVPPGMAAVIVMMAFAKIAANRPKGNVHGSQVFKWRRRPRIGERVATRFSVADAVVKNGRNWVTFTTTTSDELGAVVLEGEMISVWAR